MENLEALRHSAAHIMAQAVKRLYPKTKLSIGPSIKDGFYYDFDMMDEKLSPDDFAKIEAEMQKIVAENLPILKNEISRADAKKMMKQRGETYKLELIDAIEEGEKITTYTQGDFVEVCAGPHVKATGDVKAFKLMALAGAYWRGDVKNKMLVRVYGTAFGSKKELDEYLFRMEEAKKRDHRKIGTELFAIMPEGPGFPFFFPKGMVIRNELEKFWREIHAERNYQEIKTPIVLNQSLWHQSGHWDHYKENMYTTKIDGLDYALKPMNCPGALLVYKNEIRSYRDFPIKFSELGLVHRHENSGNLQGLMRVRCFTQDDAHVFMTNDQIKTEVFNVINMIGDVYAKFGFNYKVELSTRPKNSMGTDEQWNSATTALKNALDEKGIAYVINEGDGAFYGPKIDFHLEDCIGRTWQCGTIQLDFQMPGRFGCEYVGADGQKHTPVMIHHVTLGSVERFIGMLIEHTAAKFPLWLSPVQVSVLPVSERHFDYAKEVADEIRQQGIRVDVDLSSEKLGYKMRQSIVKKNPYTVVIGDKEVEGKLVTVRKLDNEEQVQCKAADFAKKLKKDIDERKI